VDDAQSAASPADCAAHGDRRSNAVSPAPNYRDAIAHNHGGSGVGPPLASTDRGMIARRLTAMEEMVGQLATLLSKKDAEDEDSQVASDWRRVAAFADRCLFWIFLVVTVVYTITTMVLVPFCLQ